MTTKTITPCKRDGCDNPHRPGGGLCLDCYWWQREKERSRPLLAAAAEYREVWEKNGDDPDAGAALLTAWLNLLAAVKQWQIDAMAVGKELGRPEITKYQPFQVGRKSGRKYRIKAAAHAVCWLTGTARETAALEALHYAAATDRKLAIIRGVEPDNKAE